MDTLYTPQNTSKRPSQVPDQTDHSSPPLSPTTVPRPPTSLFLRLSPELRNQIYQNLYTSSVIKVSTDTPGFPLTCKQIYTESTDLLYASTAFFVEDWETLLRWLKQLPPHRRNLIKEIWCGADMALLDDPKANVTCHGVLRRIARRLENLGLGLSGVDVLRSGVQVDEAFNVWSSDPTLAWLVVNKAFCDWVLQQKALTIRQLPAADAVRVRVMERLYELSEGHNQHTIAPEMTTKEDRLRYRFLRL